MQWKYTPISVRFLSGESFACSGVSLVLNDGQFDILEYNFTICTLPKSVLDNSQVYITNDSLARHEQEEVVWYEAQLDFNLRLNVEELEDFRKFGFKFVPQDLPYNSSSWLINLTHYGSRSLSSRLNGYKPITFVNIRDYVPIEIIAYPFSFTNPLVFSKFKTNGFINYFNNSGYLSDIKYLENTLGSVVNLSPSKEIEQSIGLVMSNLRKYNGDGDLIFIVSWKVIWSTLNKHFPNNIRLNKLAGLQTSQLQLPNVPNTINNSVVPILIQGTNQTWGSCIIFNSNYLITNHHVIKPTLDSTAIVKIVLSNSTITLTDEDEIITPFNADLSFIRLSISNQMKLTNSSNVPVKFATSYNINDPVKSISFGLFYNKDPIITFGRIQAIKRLRIQSVPEKESEKELEKINSLIIASSSCWNGSSGGGLFKDDKLIGIICSNAQVKYINLETNKEQSEKLNKLSFILPIDLILKYFEPSKYQLTSDFENLWNLVPYHKDIIAKL